MKNIKLGRQITALFFSVALFASCDKIDSPEPLGDAGKTIVKIVGGGMEADPAISVKAIDFVSTPTTIVGADVRRDIPNSAELNKTMVVTVKDDTAAVTAAGLEHLDPSWYTVGASTPKTGGQAGTYTITLAPGEFAKPIDITITDATLLNPSLQYGLGFTIMTADTDGQLSVQAKSIVLQIGAKNDYDGVYEVTGTYVDNTNPAFSGYHPFEYHLVTTGATSVDVKMEINSAIVPGYLFLTSPTTASYFGSYGIAMSVDASTNQVTDFRNYYGDPTKAATAVGTPSTGTGAPLYASAAPLSRRAVLDPAGANTYDPATKTFTMKYWIVQANVTPGNPRGVMTETWRYIGPR